MTNRKSNASDPFAVALRLLTGRDRSCAELRQRLSDRGFEEAAIEDAIGRCRDYGYLDDRRFAFNRARSLISSGRAVGRRAEMEMQRHGLDAELIDLALAEAEAEVDLVEILCELMQRRYPDYDDARAEARTRQRIIGYFQRRGFPLALILKVLKQEIQ